MKFQALCLMSLVGATSAFAPTFTSNQGQQFALHATRKPFISGNWKLNPQTKDEAVKLASKIADSITSSSPDADVALFVPFVFLEAAVDAVGGKLQVGAEVRKEKEVLIFEK
jgi:triosephosphate isomerase (TIM)